MKTQVRIAAVAIAISLASSQTAMSQASAAPGTKADQNFIVPRITPTVPTGWKPVARVNGTVLVERDLVQEMYNIFPYAQVHKGFPKQLEPEIRRGALQMLIFEELVYQEAKRRHMTVPPARLAQAETELRHRFPNPGAYQQFLKAQVNGSQAAMREKIRRALLIDSLLKQEVNGPARVTVEQARAQYQKNLAQYKHGEILHIQSISIIPPNRSAAVLKEAKQRAEQAAKESKQAKSYREFGLLAEKISDDDFRVNMGDHKPMEADKLPPPIVELAKKMKPGDVSDLIQLGDYYTIFRLEARVSAGVTPFAEVQAKLQSDMEKERTERLRSAFSQKLHKNAKIEIL